MKNITLRIAPAANAAFSHRTLLGKSCRGHVEAALEGAGLSLSNAAIPSPVVLWVREDAPCLEADSLTALTDAARKGQTAALFSADEKTLLAAAFPSNALANSSPEAFASQLSPKTSDFCLTENSPVVDCAASYSAALQLLKQRIMEKHMANGVIFLEPTQTIVEADVAIGAGTMLFPGNVLQGKTVIGESCILYPNNRISNGIIGNETTIENSVLLDCTVGSHTTVGPFAYLRPKTKIGDHCRIGDFVEVKNSAIDDGTKVSHLTYVGDSDLGKNINLGCGVVFVNYDGKSKSRSVVEDHAFIGCNCNLVSPVHIGKSAYLAAGSTITEDVPEDALYIARSQGTVKKDWVKRRKEKGKL